MMPFILLASVALFVVAYVTYGRFLERQFGVNDAHPTPSHTDYDGVDRVPAARPVLLGHHFSSIAGAGPIVGPILAAVAFGWLPALLWIVLGSILIGGVHDFSALMASIRHKARSIAEIAKQYMTPLAYKLFLVFIWLALVYVLTVFADLTAGGFVENGGVASSAGMFVVLALAFGVLVYRFKVRIVWASLVFVPLVFLAVWLGQQMPVSKEMISALVPGMDPKKVWSVVLIGYCFVASTTPVWILLQPRDYLSSYLLYAAVIGGFIGILFGGLPMQYAPVTTWFVDGLGPLVPILFITVACGACSGFHSIVASGTTSKQLNRESDARPIGYGAMLIEGVVAIIALCTVAMLPATDGSISGKFNAMNVFGSGIGRFLSVIGVPAELGKSFGLLAMSTFILTTLDTATRLSRYIFEEFFNLTGALSRCLSTAATLVLPTVFVLMTLRGPDGQPMAAWRLIWPAFGATNQLLAGLALLVVAIWLRKMGRKNWFVVGPMVFMNVMTIWALVMLLGEYRFEVVGLIAGVLLLLALVLIVEGIRTVVRKRGGGPGAAPEPVPAEPNLDNDTESDVLTFRE